MIALRFQTGGHPWPPVEALVGNLRRLTWVRHSSHKRVQHFHVSKGTSHLSLKTLVLMEIKYIRWRRDSILFGMKGKGTVNDNHRVQCIATDQEWGNEN